MARQNFYQSALFRRVGSTPLIELSIAVAGLTHQVILKCENTNPTKSIKDREAWCMVSAGLESGKISKGETLFCSDDSIDFLIALGYTCATHSTHLSAIVRQTIVPRLEKLTIGMPVSFVPYVTDGGHTSSSQRSEAIRNFRRDHLELLYLDDSQTIDYSYIHKEWTAKEIFDQVKDRIDFIFCTGSTGSLLRGLSDYVEVQNQQTKLAFIESQLSSASNGEASDQLMLLGFGANQNFSNIDWNSVGYRTKIRDNQALAVTELINERIGLEIGPASGGTIAGALHFLAQQEDPMRVLCICNDGSRAISDIDTTDKRWPLLRAETTKSKILLEKILFTAKILP